MNNTNNNLNLSLNLSPNLIKPLKPLGILKEETIPDGKRNLILPTTDDTNYSNSTKYGKYDTNLFNTSSEFDITNIIPTIEELYKQKVFENIDTYGSIQNINDKTNQKMLDEITNDIKLILEPSSPTFNHMTIDDIRKDSGLIPLIDSSGNPIGSLAQSTQSPSTTKEMAEGFVGIPTNPNPAIITTPKIITDLNDIPDLNSLTNETNSEFNSIANLVDKNINKSNKHLFTQKNLSLEYMRCRLSALYFIENYISVPVAGGRVSMKESDQWNATDKYKIIIDLFQQHDSVLYMSSRQSGKTTTSAMYLLWCMIFFPKLQISYLTLDKNRAIDMISRMKEMMDSLPKWLQIKPKSGAERLTYYELVNGSKISASFVSGSNDPDKVGRGLSSPVVFIDETAFINHAEIVWGALQPSVSAAKIFAKKNGYPNGVIFTSTPNGAGSNFFYNVYQNSVKFDDIYDYENKKLHDNYQKEFSKPEKNSFISVVLHWSEFRSQEWYEEQRKELNFNQRKISQELDLSFLGSDSCIFTDEIIAQLVPKKRQGKINLPYGCELDLYDNLDTESNSFGSYGHLGENPDEVYILGVDTAMSTGSGSDYSALTLTRASDGKPVGEWHGRFSVVKRFAQVVKALIKSLKILYGFGPERLKVVIERNSIGKETVEELIYDESNFDYEEYLFHEVTETGERVPGLYTSNSGKMGQGKRDKMFNIMMTLVNEKPHLISGPILLDELRNLEQKQNGRIEASRNQHDDNVMAWNFCLYVRKYLIDKGELFIKGESKLQAQINSAIVGSVLSAGNTFITPSIGSSDDNGSTNSAFIAVDNTIMNKMTGISKMELKTLEDERTAILKDIAFEAANSVLLADLNPLNQYVSNNEKNGTGKAGGIGNSGNQRADLSRDDYFTQSETFDPSDFMIL